MLMLVFINVFYPRLLKINFTFCVSVVIILEQYETTTRVLHFMRFHTLAALQ